MPRDLEDAARVDGASEIGVFRHVMVPLAAPALAAGLVMSWARSLGEFGATILFAGNVAGRTQTLPLVVYAEFGGGDLDAAIAAATVLVLAAIGVLVAVRLGRRGRALELASAGLGAPPGWRSPCVPLAPRAPVRPGPRGGGRDQSDAGAGWPKRKPCPRLTPRAWRVRRSASVSMPSAMTSRFVAWAKWRRPTTSAWRVRSALTPRTSPMSILTKSGRSSTRWLKLATPAPASSTAMRRSGPRWTIAERRAA